MGTSNKGIWLVIALGAGLGVAFAAYYVMVIGPRGERSEMTAQIDEWAKGKWYPTRSCLVGREPRAGNGYDAIVLRSAIPGSSRPERGDCTGFFADLARPGAVSSGNAKVEADWRDLELTIGALANSYAGYSPDSHHDRESLGTALEKADAAYAKLREDAGMSVSRAHESTQGPVAEAALITTKLGDAFSVSRVDVYGSTLLVHGFSDRGKETAIVSAADAAAFVPAAPRDRIADHRGVWAAWSQAVEGRHFEIHAGARDDDEGVQVWQSGRALEAASPIFASGAASQRLLLFQRFDDATTPDDDSAPTGPTYLASRSLDGGLTWAKPQPIGAGELVASLIEPVRGRLDLVWQSGDDLEWLAVDSPTADLVPRPLMPASRALHQLDNCLGETASWWASRGQSRALHYVANATASATEVNDGSLIHGIADCNDSRLLGIRDGDDGLELMVCTATGCAGAFTVPVAADGQFAAALAADNGPVAATLTGDLLVVWRSGAPEQQHKIVRVDGDDPYLRALVEWDGTIHAIMIEGGELRVRPLPL